MTNNNEIYHYGVPGMKWGQRRAATKLQKVSTRAKKRGWSDEATEVAKIKTKKVKQMSNKELTTVNNRKSLEKNYSQLNPNAIKKGLTIAGTTVAALGTITALAKYGKQIGNAGKNAVQKIKENRSSMMSAKVSKSFWKDMGNAKIMSNTDFSDLLK